jgi:hypothetical protein
MRKLPYEATLIPPDVDHPGEWWVSASGADGEIFMTAFWDHDAERRAREYAEASFASVDCELGHRPRPMPERQWRTAA